MNSNDHVDDGTNQRKTNRGVNFECLSVNAKVVVMNKGASIIIEI